MLGISTSIKGAELAQHVHSWSQRGIIIKGRVNFIKGDGEVLHLKAGDSYYFAAMKPHSLKAHEEAEPIECFAPLRDNYKD